MEEGNGDNPNQIDPRVRVHGSKSSHQLKSSKSITFLKEPWVPPPAKTAVSGSILEDNNSKENKFPVFKSKSSKKPNNRRRHRTGQCSSEFSGYELKSKDSLLDVAACLSERRDEVLQLWEKNLPEGDPGLMEELEKANNYALEAFRDVDHLRKSIQDLQKKPAAQLTPRSQTELDALRTKVISKLELFEEAHVNIQKRLQGIQAVAVRESGSQTDLDIPAIPSRSGSRSRSRPRTSVHGNAPKTLTRSKSSIVILKERPTPMADAKGQRRLAFASESDEGEATEDECMNVSGFENDHRGKFKPAASSTSNSTTRIHMPLAKESLDDLSKLYHIYTNKEKEDKYNFNLGPLLEEQDEHDCGSHPHDHVHKRGQGSQVQGQGDQIGCVYREKFHALHEKLMEQETKTEELTREMRRLESQSDFDMKMFKSRVKERLEELEHLPDVLQIMEKRLGDALEGKYRLDTTVQLKCQEIAMLRKETERLTKELGDWKKRGESQAKKIQDMTEKNEKLEGVNQTLRNDLKISIEEVERLKKSAKSASARESSVSRPPSNNSRVFLLEDRVLELERELAKEKKRSAILKQAKDNLSVQMTRREEEVLESLEEARRRNRSLQNQLLFIKSSYHSIFPPDLIQPMVEAKGQMPDDPEI